MVKNLLAEEREHEGIGIPNRTWERRPGSNLVITLWNLSGCGGRETSLFRMVG